MLARRKTALGSFVLSVLIAAAGLAAADSPPTATARAPQIQVRQSGRAIAGASYASSDRDIRVKVTGLQRGSRVCLFIDGEPNGAEKAAKKGEVKFSVPCAVGHHKVQAKERTSDKKDRWTAIAEFHVVEPPRRPEVLALVCDERRFMPSGKVYWVDRPRFDVEVAVPDAMQGDRIVAYEGKGGAPLAEATLGTEPTARISLDLRRDRKRDMTFQVYRGGVGGKRSELVQVRAPKSLPTAAVRGPNPASGAFAFLPQVRPVVARDEVGGDKQAAEPLRSKGFTFDLPAHFPLPEFARDGEPIEEVGLVVYEGMRFVVEPDGHYLVRFLASAPAMPVELRLQFFVADKYDSCWVTLPPIRLPEKKPGKVEEGAYLVQHEGYLSNIIDWERFAVQRWGTARFGHGLIDAQ